MEEFEEKHFSFDCFKMFSSIEANKLKQFFVKHSNTTLHTNRKCYNWQEQFASTFIIM